MNGGILDGIGLSWIRGRYLETIRESCSVMMKDEATQILAAQSFILGYSPRHLRTNTFLKWSSSTYIVLAILSVLCTAALDPPHLRVVLCFALVICAMMGAILVWAVRVRTYWKDRIIVCAEGLGRRNPERGNLFFPWEEIAPPTMNILRDELRIRSCRTQESFVIDVSLLEFPLVKAIIEAMTPPQCDPAHATAAG